MTAIPISALHGDNVVTRSERIGWYTGPSVLEHLENVDLTDDSADGPLRFPVQYVIRPRSDELPGLPRLRGPGGRRHASGPATRSSRCRPGCASTVTAIDTADGERDVAVAGESVTLLLADDVDLSRGDLISGVGGCAEPGHRVHRHRHPTRRAAAAGRDQGAAAVRHLDHPGRRHLASTTCWTSTP